MASRGGYAGPSMPPSMSPMNVGHAASMRMSGLSQPPGGYPRSMNTAPQYPQVGSLFNSSSLNRQKFLLVEMLSEVDISVASSSLLLM